MAASQRRSSCVGLFLLAIVVMAAMAEGNYTVKNNSGHDIQLTQGDQSCIIAVGADVGILPGTGSGSPSGPGFKFTNLSSGHALGPFSVANGTLLVIVDSLVDKNGVDIYNATLRANVVTLGSLVCGSL